MGIGANLINQFIEMLSNPIMLILQIIAVLFALTIHEFAHAYVANKCGDPTAKYMGRLTLNPLKHLDPIGTISLFLIGFGWAKPVPVNPRNYNKPRRDDTLVSAAGIIVNFTAYLITTAICLLVEKQLRKTAFSSETVYYIVYYFWMFLYIFRMMNLGLAIFNLLPIPPYDGFHIANNVFFKGRIYITTQQMQMVQIGVILLIFSGILGNVLAYLRTGIDNGVVRLFTWLMGGI